MSKVYEPLPVYDDRMDHVDADSLLELYRNAGELLSSCVEDVRQNNDNLERLQKKGYFNAFLSQLLDLSSTVTIALKLPSVFRISHSRRHYAAQKYKDSYNDFAARLNDAERINSLKSTQHGYWISIPVHANLVLSNRKPVRTLFGLRSAAASRKNSR